jgi:ADP-heptose:LPS heptosyltransferase
MTSNFLILIDSILSILLQLAALGLRAGHRLRSRLLRPKVSNGVMIIKLLGAGNFIAIADALPAVPVTIVTVSANKATINQFLPTAEVILLNQSNLLSLALSIIRAVPKMVSRRFERVVNLEAESNFAKFTAALPYAQHVTGISNKHKSIFDYLFYDFHLVSPESLHRNRLLGLLLGSAAQVNRIREQLITIHNLDYCMQQASQPKEKIFLAPTCSTTDHHRRLPTEIWEKLVERLRAKNLHVVAGFASTADPQYQDFVSLAARTGMEVAIGSYEKFVHQINTADLIITVDSQALHIAQHIDKSVICFYGPTSPNGVGLKPSTYVVSRSLECSPCTHKYYAEPCRGANQCMQIGNDLLEQVVAVVDL